MLGIFAQNLALSGIVYFIGASVGVFSVAQTIMSVVMIFSMVCSSGVMYLMLSLFIHGNCTVSYVHVFLM